MEPTRHIEGGRRLGRIWGLGVALALMLLAGCWAREETPSQRAEAAKILFERATRQFHLPSAETHGPAQVRLQEQAAAAYETLLRQYPEQDIWAAQALRSLANLRAAQTNLAEAVRLYAAVGRTYSRQEWDVLMAWKSAADLLWDAGQRDEAKGFYQNIVVRFDRPAAPAVVKTVVRGSRSRLAESNRAECD